MWKDRFFKLLFLSAILMVGFGYGVITMHMEVFPFALLKEAKLAAEAILNDGEEHVSAAHSLHYIDETETVARSFSKVDDEALILVSGGEWYLTSHHPRGCMAWLVNRKGEVKHIWKFPTELWNDLKYVKKSTRWQYQPGGMKVEADGSLIVSFQSNGWPYGLGIAKFDKDSNILWKKENLAHHWFSVDEKGRIYTPAHRVIEAPRKIGHSHAEFVNEKEMVEDVVLVLDEKGNTLKEIRPLKILEREGYIGLYQGAAGDGLSTSVNTWDPIHLNDVVLVNEKSAGDYPWLNKGDLLLSFRNINTIGILNPETESFSWISTGLTLRQHSPRFNKGNLLVFDNLGGDSSVSPTRVAKIDLDRRRSTTVFPAPNTKLPRKPFSRMAGYIDINPDGRRALVVFAYQSVIWEIDIPTGEILFEYIYAKPGSHPESRKIATAQYYYGLDFPMNQ